MIGFRFSNRTVAVAIALVAAGYLVLAFRLPEFTAVEVPVQPSTLPKWLGALLLLLAAALFVQRTPAVGTGTGTPAGDAADAGGTAASSTAPPDDPASPGAAASEARLGRLADTRLELLLFAASIAGYIALLVPLGFLLATTLYVAGSAWYLGYRRHLVTALISVGVTALLYFGMSEGLNVALPQGPFPF